MNKERQYQAAENALKVQISQLETTLKSDLNDKKRLTDTLSQERENYAHLDSDFQVYGGIRGGYCLGSPGGGGQFWSLLEGPVWPLLGGTVLAPPGEGTVLDPPGGDCFGSSRKGGDDSGPSWGTILTPPGGAVLAPPRGEGEECFSHFLS